MNYNICTIRFKSITYNEKQSLIFDFPNITTIYASFIANDLIPVQPIPQPLNLPIGQLFYLDFVYNKPLTFKKKLLKFLKKLYYH